MQIHFEPVYNSILLWYLKGLFNVIFLGVMARIIQPYLCCSLGYASFFKKVI